ncbi:MAG: 4'-phosphopantetheinyl transferase superfamily protein [bacterium]|nr:4'-phosphopantetheinyl transferase superfamily protein [bacterium]
MLIKCGTDLVLDERIQKNINNESFIKKIFHPSELSDMDVKKLATVFAVKEAVFKALEISSKNWLEVELTYSETGKPVVTLSEEIKPKNLVSLDCSVTHENGLTQAFVVLLEKE